MKVISIALSRMRNNEYYRFIVEFIQIVGAVIARRVAGSSIVDSISSLIDILKDLAERLDAALVALGKSEFTDLVAEADNLRDKRYRGFALHVDAFHNSMDDAKREAARRLQVIIDNYGDFRRRSYDDQTAVMDNFIQDLQSMHTDNMEAIGADVWLSEMQESNNSFKELSEERHDERVSQAREEIRQLRSQIDDVYYQIASLLEVGNRLSEGAVFTDTINRINERAAYYKTILATRKGRADAKKEEEE